MTQWPLLLGAAPLALAAWKDGKTHRIPDNCFKAVLGCAAANVIFGEMKLQEAGFGLAIIGAILLMFTCADSESIGGGDIKICAAIGALVGAFSGLLIVAAALTSMVAYSALRHKMTLPFAPFLFPVYIIFLILEMKVC